MLYKGKKKMTSDLDALFHRRKKKSQSIQKYVEIGSGEYSQVFNLISDNKKVVKVIHKYRSRHNDPRYFENADQEENTDIAAEKAFVTSDIAINALDWHWMPKVFEIVNIKDILCGGELQCIISQVAKPVSTLVIMEKLDERFDEYIHRCVKENNEIGAYGSIMDLFSILVALNRLKCRHNDLMFRNVMVRYTQKSTHLKRRMTLCRQLITWEPPPGCEVVLIDYGLASIDLGSPLAAPGIPFSHKRRMDQFKGGVPDDVTNLHPLQMNLSKNHHKYIDLLCVGYSIKSMKRRTTSDKLKNWASKYLLQLTRVMRSKSPPEIENFIVSVLPIMQ